MTPIQSLLKIAKDLQKVDPLMAYELEKSIVAISNPGATSFKDKIENIVTVLKSLKQELEAADVEIDADTDLEEFAKFFDDAAEAEADQLENLLNKARRSASVRIAGPLDKLKGLFKKDDDEDFEVMKPSYDLSDEDIDAFVEGDAELDSAYFIRKEKEENEEFLNDVEKTLDDVEELREKPSRSLLKSLIDRVTQLISDGTDLLGGKRDKKIPSKVNLVEDEPAKPKTPSAKKPLNFETIVDHYADMLKEYSGDEKATVKYLKELFQQVGPMLSGATAAVRRGRILPILIRTASAHVRTRPILVPIIRRWTGK